jgi:hypothetical protein
LTAAPLFRRIDVAAAYQKVADAIEREIVNGRIKPGEPIGTELELGRQFGVNRSTVRDARSVSATLEIRQLIRDISLANPLWGAPRIHGELLKLGIDVGHCTRNQARDGSHGKRGPQRTLPNGLTTSALARNK